MTNSQEQYFQTLENKHKLQSMYSKHSDFYHECIWLYEEETLAEMAKELLKIQAGIKNCEHQLKEMREQHGWNREELKEMKAAFAAWKK